MTIKDLLKIVYNNKKVFAINCLIVAIISVFISLFVMREIFQSNAIIKSTSKSSGLSALIPDFGGIEELTGGIGSSSSVKELALYENIITSRRCLEKTIVRFKIMDEYEFKKFEDALKFFREELLELKIDKMAGTMSIGIYDYDPLKAKDINEFIISQLNEINIEMSVLDAKNNREFIEQRYNLIKENLKNAEDSLKFYQDNFGVYPEIQIKAGAQSIMELEVQIKSEEVKLELLRKILTPGESEILIQQDKINSLKKQLSELKNNEYGEYDIGMKGAPEVAMNFLRLARNVEIQNKILTFILPIFEQAKIEENKNTPTIMVLDPPSVPDKKAKPKRAYVVIGMTLLAFLLTFSYYLYKLKIKGLRYFLTNND